MKIKMNPALTLAIILVTLTVGMALSLNTFRYHKEFMEVKSVNNIEVASLSALSISLIDRSNPAFEGLFSTLVSIPKEIEESAKIFSIFVSNNSDRAVIAYSVKWDFLQPNGKIITDSRTYYQLQIKEGNLHPALLPHTSRFLTLIQGIATTKYPASLIKVPAQTPGDKEATINSFMNNGISELHKKLEKSASWSVTLDSVLFADGTFVGSDTLGNFDKIKAKSDARQDLLREISNIIDQSKGDTEKSYTDAFKHAEEVLGSGVPRLSGFSASDFYKQSKAQTALEFLTRRDKLGIESAIDFIKSELLKPQMQLVKVAS